MGQNSAPENYLFMQRIPLFRVGTEGPKVIWHVTVLGLHYLLNLSRILTSCSTAVDRSTKVLKMVTNFCSPLHKLVKGFRETSKNQSGGVA